MKALEPYLGFIKAVMILATALGLVYAGMRMEANKMLKQQVRVVNQVLEAERGLQDVINASTSDYINQLKKMKGKTDALPKIVLVNDCAVPAAVSRVLNDAQRVHTDAGTESAAGGAGKEVDSTCAAELDIAKRNYAEVCVPNEVKLEQLQREWEMVRPFMNESRQ